MRCSKILLWVIVMQCCPANARNESEEPNIIIIPDHDESSCTLTGKLKKASNSTNGYKFSTPGESLGNSSMVADKESMEDSLILEVVSSPVLKLGIQLKIDHNGLYRSLRSQQDGVTYIGSQDSEGDTVLNDFVISHHSVSNIHCSVYYNSDSRQFILKDHSDSSGTFMKIMKPIRLASQQIISFVSYHLAVNCISEESE
jgi:hypothetical protein